MPPRRNRKLRIAIIGSGRLGSALAIALDYKHYPIESMVAKRLQSAQRAAALLDCRPTALAARQLGKLPAVDLILIATPDDQIANVVGELLRLEIDWFRKTIVLHTSGALSSDILAPLREKGLNSGSLHPLVSVSEPAAGAVSLRGAFWCVEGDARATRVAKTLVRDLEGKSFSVRAAEKALYHAAAVMASGNVTALFDVALEMMVKCGLTRKNARLVLQPLIASTIQNLETRDPVDALTGTFSRGDLETVKRHLEALETNKLEDALELYRLLGKRSLKLTKKHPQITQILN
jgi:predicted short-subunit dehydrogenase-like oxidoreductase (DUF2520 family)